MSKIIKIEPINEYFSINWIIGLRCNYDCMYCPSTLHDANSTPHSLETLKQAWTNIYSTTKSRGLKYKIAFTGGEVTANKNFLSLVKWIKENFGQHLEQLIVSTNGSASLRYYKELAKIVDAISFSFHSEFADEREFFNKARELNQVMPAPEKSFHINIMNEYWNADRIPKYTQWLDANSISYSVNLVSYDQKTRDYVVFNGNKNFENI